MILIIYIGAIRLTVSIPLRGIDGETYGNDNTPVTVKLVSIPLRGIDGETIRNWYGYCSLRQVSIPLRGIDGETWKLSFVPKATLMFPSPCGE